MGEGRTEGLVCVWREWRVVMPRESGEDEARRLLKQGTHDLCRATSAGSEGEREGPGKLSAMLSAMGRFRESWGVCDRRILERALIQPGAIGHGGGAEAGPNGATRPAIEPVVNEDNDPLGACMCLLELLGETFHS